MWIETDCRAQIEWEKKHDKDMEESVKLTLKELKETYADRYDYLVVGHSEDLVGKCVTIQETFFKGDSISFTDELGIMFSFTNDTTEKVYIALIVKPWIHSKV